MLNCVNFCAKGKHEISSFVQMSLLQVAIESERNMVTSELTLVTFKVIPREKKVVERSF